MITGEFGYKLDIKSGWTRRWYMRDGIKRWFDTDEPVGKEVAVERSSTTSN